MLFWRLSLQGVLISILCIICITALIIIIIGLKLQIIQAI
jgi:hypothetical protein